MSAKPAVLSPTELDNSGVVGETIQVSIVAEDAYAAMDDLLALGIGPFMVFEVGPENSDMHYRGERGGFSMKLCLATHGAMMWEVVEPTGGRSIYSDFVEAGQKGFHHVGIDGTGTPYEERAQRLRERGYEEVQGGTAFDGRVPFAYFHNGSADAPWLEIFDFPEDFEPVPDEWYPAPPPAA